MNSLQNKAFAGWRLVATCAVLVCILGTAAYVLFSYSATDTESVRARQKDRVVKPTPPPTTLAGKIRPTLPAAADSSPQPEPTPVSVEDASPVDAMASLAGTLVNASADQQETANKLLTFAATGRMDGISELSREEVEALARYLVDHLGVEAIASLLESRLQFPAEMFLRQPNPPSALADLFEAVKGNGTPQSPQTVVFTDHCEVDGTVTGNTHVIPAGTRRVYAAFENAGGLHGLDRVLAVWRDPNNAQMVFTECEPVHTGSTYNYVWLELKDGWPEGYYQLDIYHPQQTTQLLASRGFNVR